MRRTRSSIAHGAQLGRQAPGPLDRAPARAAAAGPRARSPEHSARNGLPEKIAPSRLRLAGPAAAGHELRERRDPASPWPGAASAPSPARPQRGSAIRGGGRMEKSHACGPVIGLLRGRQDRLPLGGRSTPASVDAWPLAGARARRWCPGSKRLGRERDASPSEIPDRSVRGDRAGGRRPCSGASTAARSRWPSPSRCCSAWSTAALPTPSRSRTPSCLAARGGRGRAGGAQRRGSHATRASWSLRAPSVRATVAVPPLLLERRLQLAEVQLDLPSIELTRDDERQARLDLRPAARVDTAG